MPKKPIFLTDKNKQKEILTKISQIINKRYEEKGSEKRVTVEELIKRCEDPKRLKVYEQCREVIEYNKKLSDYSTDLQNRTGIKTDPGYKRHSFSLFELPTGSEKEKEEIEKRNIEILKNISDKDKVREQIKSDIKMLYDCDKTKFFPKNIDECLKLYNSDRKLFETSFVFDSIISNSSNYVNNDLIENYDYYKSFLESGNVVKLEIEGKSSEFSLFMPDDFDREDVLATSGEMAIIGFTEANVFSDKAYDNYLQERDYYLLREKTASFVEKFVRENDKDHKMLYNMDIGGETFDKEIERCALENVTPTIQHNFKNVDKALDKDLIPFEGHYFTFLTHDKKSTINKIKENKIDLKDFIDSSYSTKKDKETNKVIKTFRTKNIPDIIGMINAASSVDSPVANEIKTTCLECLKKENVSDKFIKEYSDLLNLEYPHEYVNSIDNDGIHFNDKAPKEITNLYNLKSSRFESMKSLESKTKNIDFKENITQFLNNAKIAKERNSKRGFFSQIFSSEAWAERRVINNARNEAVKNGISKDEFNSMLLKSDKEFNQFTTEKDQTFNSIESKSVDTKIQIHVNELDEDIVNKDVTVNQKDLSKNLSKNIEETMREI